MRTEQKIFTSTHRLFSSTANAFRVLNCLNEMLNPPFPFNVWFKSQLNWKHDVSHVHGPVCVVMVYAVRVSWKCLILSIVISSKHKTENRIYCFAVSFINFFFFFCVFRNFRKMAREWAIALKRPKNEFNDGINFEIAWIFVECQWNQNRVGTRSTAVIHCHQQNSKNRPKTEQKTEKKTKSTFSAICQTNVYENHKMKPIRMSEKNKFRTKTLHKMKQPLLNAISCCCCLIELFNVAKALRALFVFVNFYFFFYSFVFRLV